MLELLWIVPFSPLLGFLFLVLYGRRLPEKYVAIIGTGSVAISSLIIIFLWIGFLRIFYEESSFSQKLWTSFSIDQISLSFSFYLDALSLVMISVVALVGFLIHLYSIEYMRKDEGFSRFMAYMNLFTAAMLILLLADNVFLLFIGWEGVGLCSYLLIGFWYQDQKNCDAAMKAFFMTRIADTAMMIGMFFLVVHFGTNIQNIVVNIKGEPTSTWLVIASILVLLGGLGKSAQVPFQTWLPDAMAGPTPVSALIHAATMVTAGVYLVARFHTLFSLNITVQELVMIVGLITSIVAGLSALTQTDIKRVLAYSTMSQIGYMFIALGSGAFSVAIFHFVTHAFFKALLFLCAGAVIVSLGHEQDMLKMGGLRKKLPLVFWTFLIGACGLSSIPLITGGFLSKEMILSQTYTAPFNMSHVYWGIGVLGALITALYTFRMLILVFWGEEKGKIFHHVSFVMILPLLILAGFTVGSSLLENRVIGISLTTFLSPVFGALAPHSEYSDLLPIIISLLTLAVVSFSFLLFLRNVTLLSSLKNSGLGSFVHKFLTAGWGFDFVFTSAIVKPFLLLISLIKKDPIDIGCGGIGQSILWLGSNFRKSDTSVLGHYIVSLILGVLLLLGGVLLYIFVLT